MRYFLILIFLVIGYHTFSYGVNVLKNEKNKLAAFGVFLLAVAGVCIPAVMLFVKRI